MVDRAFTPDEVKLRRAEQIAGSTTFTPHGVSVEKAREYLASDEGAQYLEHVRRSDPRLDDFSALDRAIGQVMTGKDVPRKMVISEPLVKFTPDGVVDPGLKHTPYWTFQSAHRNAVATGRNVNDVYGLPIKSEAKLYAEQQIVPKEKATVWVSEVAPTSELTGADTQRRQGGALQVLVPDRGQFHPAQQVGKQVNPPTPDQVRQAQIGKLLAAQSPSPLSPGKLPANSQQATGINLRAGARDYHRRTSRVVRAIGSPERGR